MVSSPWCFSYLNDWSYLGMNCWAGCLKSVNPSLSLWKLWGTKPSNYTRAKMWTRNEPILLSLWFLSTVGFCMILLPRLKVYSIGSTHIFSHAILQNKWELSIKQPFPWRFLELYREMLWLLRDHFLNTATNTRRLHTAEHSKRCPSKYWQHNCDGCHSSHKKLF